MLREGEAHGYELAEQPRARSASTTPIPGRCTGPCASSSPRAWSSRAGSSSSSGPPKRVYALTERGVEELDLRATDLAEGERRIDSFLDRYLKARRLPAGHRRRRALTGRRAAHLEAAARRESFGAPR